MNAIEILNNHLKGKSVKLSTSDRYGLSVELFQNYGTPEARPFYFYENDNPHRVKTIGHVEGIVRDVDIWLDLEDEPEIVYLIETSIGITAKVKDRTFSVDIEFIATSSA